MRSIRRCIGVDSIGMVMDVLINGCSQAWDKQKAFFFKLRYGVVKQIKKLHMPAPFHSSEMPTGLSLLDKLLWYATNVYLK